MLGQPSNVSAVADPRFLKGDFSLTKTPAQFELKTPKKKSSTFILLSW